jgi:hypothetical protein
VVGRRPELDLCKSPQWEENQGRRYGRLISAKLKNRGLYLSQGELLETFEMMLRNVLLVWWLHQQ